MLTTLDHRIHFALNCGGASCPAVKEYSKENLDSELKLASMGFLESTDNMKIDLNQNSIYFNRIFSWYFNDFGKSKEIFLQQIVPHLRKQKKQHINDILMNTHGVAVRDIKFKYYKYDWTSNASPETKYFVKGNLILTKRQCTIL